MKPRRLLRQHGAAAIEMAFVLLYCFGLLSAALYVARYTLHAGVMQQAVQGAARFVSALPQEDFMDADRRTAAMDAANNIINGAVASARLDTPPEVVTIMCDAEPCNTYASSVPPGSIHVLASTAFDDPGFLGYLAGKESQKTLVYESRLRYGY